MLKTLSILLIILGELLAIYAEVQAARKGFTFASFFPAVFVITLAGGMLVIGYVLGVAAFGDIWVVSVISITSIIVAEPIVNYMVFRDLPSIGTAVGFGLGALGLVVSLVFK